MEVKHLIELLSELTPGTRCKYVRGDDVCTFVKIDTQEQRLYTKTPLNEEFTFAQSFIIALANKIEENVPFNTSQLLNNKGSNRAVIDSIIAHTSEFYWLQKDRSKFTVWVPSDPHNAGELVEWKDIKALAHNRRTKNIDSSEPLQQIFYGAPGTGKSHRVNEVTEAQPEENVFRTTFHPDSDYSTFVGCYKPTKEPSLQKQPILDYDSLVDKLKEYLAIEPVNITRSCALFGYDYHDCIVKMQDGGGHTIPSLVADAYKSGTTYDSTVRAGMSIYESGVKTQNTSSTITYTFVPQAFTKAYIRAWQTEEPVYLVIEEINRGNCAQIFGDLFQLLDRKEGKSEYPIKPDTDLGNFIAEKLSSHVDGAPEKVVNGELMILPKNLYIWATMNTSDQSLFPIDSAFKRRWDWVYIPISASDEDNFGIKVGKHFYDWGKFISQMNRIVADVTSSEDKQLGYYFCKADEGSNIISANRFVNKVLFYLWNDVFKNYGFEAALDGKAVFKYKNDEGKDDTMSFTSFYISNGLPNVKQIKRLMDNLGLEGFDNWPAERAAEDSSDGTAKLLSVTYNDNVVDGTSNKEIFLKTLELIVKDISADKVAGVIGGEMIKNPPSSSETTRDYKKVGDSDWYVATRNGKERFLRHLINLANNLELNLTAK